MVSESKMREILFRGKRLYGVGWAEGSLVVFPKSKITKIMVWNAADLDFDAIEVIPETVGQFTGLTDKNGKKIFEGDITRYITPDDTKATGVIRFGAYGTGGTLGIGFYVAWVARDGAGWLRQDIGFWAKYRDIEIIGNIHDNPELLEVSHA